MDLKISGWDPKTQVGLLVFGLWILDYQYMAGASLCSYSAPGLRWFLASNLETSAVWVCGVHGAGNLTTLKLTSKGRAPCASGAGGLRDAGSWWCSGAHPPDMGRPTYGSARMVYVGWPQLQESSLDRKYSSRQVWDPEWKTTINDERLVLC